ncbi:hypothetical protein [Atopobacter phocae]|uniref:hypothetical protein n=1 Tax=Atopobacter phocae TaxID=136492 RepID=UPI00047041A8|nr:hypothetical protein [Atopobacter phocae]
MIRMSALIGFHLRQYSRNSYFIMNVLLATVSLVLFQYLAASVYHESITEVAWIRAGIFGLWASGTTAAGIVGMQKWQGTLLYLINNPLSDYVSLVALVVPAATFGLLSFPIAYGVCLMLGVTNMILTAYQLIFILLLWIGATILDLCIASLFILTKDAIIYETIIELPLLIFSGLFTLPAFMMRIVDVLEWIIPISLPIQWLLQQESFSFNSFLRYVISNLMMLTISFFVTRRIIEVAKQTGQFGGLS